MQQYQDLLRTVLEYGTRKSDRTGTGTTSLFGYQMRFDLTKGFPLQTTKRVFWKGVVEELLWMLRGETNATSLQERGVHIWDEWAVKEGDAKPYRPVGHLGPIYGHQWRKWQISDHPATEDTLDQIQVVIDQLLDNPDSRRIIVSAWNPADLDAMALPPCHMMFQFYTRPMTLRQRWNAVAHKADHARFDTLPEDVALRLVNEANAPHRFIDCQLYQRSADAFLGVPFNIASYALLTHMIGREVGMVPGNFVHTFGDVHIYDNHRDQVEEVLRRDPRPLPELIMNANAKRLSDFKSVDDFILVGYDPHPPISAPVAV